MAESPEFGELRKIRSSYKNNIGAVLPLATCALDKRQSIAVSAKLNKTLFDLYGLKDGQDFDHEQIQVLTVVLDYSNLKS
jgi:hypothetical protein